jgi:hypothetical protein
MGEREEKSSNRWWGGSRIQMRDGALPGQDVKNLHPGFESSLVAISLPLDVVLALVFQQRLAVSLV